MTEHRNRADSERAAFPRRTNKNTKERQLSDIMQLILASTSPRRRDILSGLGVPFTVVTAPTDEHSDITDGPTLVRELSCRKARAVRQLLLGRGTLPPDALILGADTMVIDPDGCPMGKPQDPGDAARMLRLLSGRRSAVVSGVTLMDAAGRTASDADTTEVEFDPLDEATIARYVASGEPMDKAGAYALQGIASLWIRGIHGDHFNVVGLPVHCLEQLMQQNFHMSLWEIGSPVPPRKE